ncbi:MAG TPA: hypothetical protein VJY33_09525 [Isosphaeraceae bacterium]|nr:hypothetical protein [Isosphaeraceae bacterium]
MAFIVLRRSRNTLSYYLVESYRDGDGNSRKRTLCYLGREADATDTLEKALAHWQKARAAAKRRLRSSKGAPRHVLRRRLEATEARIGIIVEHIRRAADADAERARRAQLAEERTRWLAFDHLRRNPTEENARAARRAFYTLAKRYHPDQGGTHHDFLRLKDAYDRAVAAYRVA